MTKVTRGSVVSADGTEIGYSRFGEGSPIVICHGTLSLAEDWTAFARELGASNAVYLYDRRGRGRSPDTGKAYSFAAELNDLATVVTLAGSDAVILGHSFGGGCAFAYALRDGFGGRLVLYELCVPKTSSVGDRIA
jgi:pimeloyl-ACP methyl ester carboxylesterase